MDDAISQKLRICLDAANALLDSMNTLLAREKSAFHFSPYKTFVRKYNQIVDAVAKLTVIDLAVETFNLDKIPDAFNTTGIAQQNIFYDVHTNLSILIAFLENKIGVREDRLVALIDFFQANLRKAIFDEPGRETDVQNAIEQLLIGRGMEKGIDYDRETGRVKVSIKEVIPDFIFPTLGLALEVKLAKTPAKSKTIVDEINADIQSYGKTYRSILFVVYDIGSIRDESEFKRDLQAIQGVSVIVIKH